MTQDTDRIVCTISPWLAVPSGRGAVDFYKEAFGAVEVYRHDGGESGIVARLSIDKAEFWVGEESAEDAGHGPQSSGGCSVRMILTVADPDALFAQAVAAGASEVYPISEGHGWRIGRIVDPYGYHWEIGHPLTANAAG